MIDRTPVYDVPLTCYGIDHCATAKICQKCQYSEQCISIMGNRAGHVPVDSIKFRPSSAINIDGISCLDYNESKAEEVYLECYRAVFPEYRPDNPCSVRNFGKVVIEQSERADTTLRMFILANMVGFKNSNSDRRYFAKFLVSQSAVKRVSVYRSAATSMFGTFDPQALDDLAENVSIGTIGNPMLESEELSARWVTGWKSRNAGNPFPRFFRINEMRMHPCWLAIDPHYAEYVKKYSPSTKEIEKVRSNVARVVRRLKSHSGKALYFAKCRGEAARKVLGSVLAQHGLRETDIRATNVVTDMMKFWSDVGVVVQHVACLRYLNGDTAALRKYIVTGSRVDVR